MAKRIRKSEGVQEIEPVSLGELIHAQVRGAIEAAVYEELAGALGAAPYERNGGRRGYRNGVKARTLTGPPGPLALTLPRGTLFAAAGEQEWTSALLPRYQRRVREVNEAVVGTYLACGNTRRIRSAVSPAPATGAGAAAPPRRRRAPMPNDRYMCLGFMSVPTSLTSRGGAP
jgi:transposase-like protein